MKLLTRRRRSWPLLSAIACIALAASAFWLAHPRVSISQATCDKIKPGMTRAEVEALIGGPPGDYSTKSALPAILELPPGVSRFELWFDDQGVIMVVFDEGGKARHIFFSDDLILLDQGFFERLRSWLGW